METAVTLENVAEVANVSISTVSLVLNGQAKNRRITAETIDRVKVAARRLNYRSAGYARSLSKGKTGCVGLLLPEMTEVLSFEIYMLMFAELNNRFHEYNLNTMVFSFDNNNPVIPKMIREKHVDGVIVAHQVPNLLLNDLKMIKMPTVFVNTLQPEQTDIIIPDDYQGISLAVKHLVGLGHKRVLYLNKHAQFSHPSMATRLQAFYECMHANDLSPYPGSDALLWRKRDDKHQPSNAVDFKVFLSKILARPAESRPTAIIAYTALWLRDLMLTIQNAGLQVPRDISVICCDQTQLVRDWIPSITHLRISSELMGQKAAELLYNKIENDAEPQEPVLLPEELIIAESTAKPLQNV